MALNPNVKSELARKAALIRHDKKRDELKERDENIRLAFIHLKDRDALDIGERNRAVRVFTKRGFNDKLPVGEFALAYLSKVTKLSRQRINNIIKSSK